MSRISAMVLAALLLLPSLAPAQEGPDDELPAETPAEAPDGVPDAEGEAGPEDGAALLVTQAAYDESLNRLGELSGALFHLDALCRPGREDVWRRHVEAFLEAQRLGDERSGRLIASFNTGYRDYAATHAACTPAARELSRRFAVEGVEITSDLAARYGN